MHAAQRHAKTTTLLRTRLGYINDNTTTPPQTQDQNRLSYTFPLLSSPPNLHKPSIQRSPIPRTHLIIMILSCNLRVNLLLLVVGPSRTRSHAVVVLLRHSWHWVRVAGDTSDYTAAVRAVSIVLGVVGFAVFVAALAFVEEGVCFLSVIC